MIIGHRGNAEFHLENTLEAILAAVDIGIGIEFDVQTCATGELVLFHDETLLRLANTPQNTHQNTPQNTPQKISDMSWSELSQINLIGGYKIPRLVDVLAHPRVKNSSLLIDIDIKDPCSSLGEILKPYPRKRFLVSSYSIPISLNKKYARGHIYDADNIATFEYSSLIKYVILDKHIVNEFILDFFKFLKIKVLVYTVNNPDFNGLDISKIHGIITDKPSLFCTF
tara:strand:+ start:148 stop:825 length:678 start_codon:yes stop_codon:yes gene_type:complete